DRPGQQVSIAEPPDRMRPGCIVVDDPCGCWVTSTFHCITPSVRPHPDRHYGFSLDGREASDEAVIRRTGYAGGCRALVCRAELRHLCRPNPEPPGFRAARGVLEQGALLIRVEVESAVQRV